MVAQRWEGDATEEAVLTGCVAAWERRQERIAHRFGRVEVRARVRRYTAGLLGRVERKNGWQLGEAIGERGPQGVQRLLNAAVWDAEAVRDDLRAYLVEHLGDAQSGVLVVDETDFPQKGRASCGVAPQYCGSLGRSANAQGGLPCIHLRQGARLYRPGAVPAPCLDQGPSALYRGRDSGRRGVRHQGHLGPTAAGAGLRRRGSHALGRG